MRFSTDNKWDKVSLNKVCEFISRGISPAYTEEDGVTVINQKCIRDNRINLELARLTNPNKKKITEQKYLKEFDILVNSTGVGTLGRVAQVKKLEVPMTVDSHVTIVRPNTNISAEFLGYNLFMQQRNIEHLAKGSTGQTELSRIDLGEKIEILLPPLEVQKAIANIFASLDEKIELNNQMNKTLEEMAQALFKRWFVDFEFPNENGEPYKSSGGEMVDSELGMIPKGWKVGYLDDIIEIYDAKRKPLSSRQRANMAKNYPYYGAASLVDYVENYLFDGIYVLISEDGANVVDADGYPLVQYVWDKFWVNNHAHIVKGKNGYSEEHIYILVKNTNMRSIVTGAVQPKINQANLKSVNIVIAQAIIIEKFNDLLTSVFNQYRSNAIENEKLKEMRDILLPKLMSGEIRVTDLQN